MKHRHKNAANKLIGQILSEMNCLVSSETAASQTKQFTQLSVLYMHATNPQPL